MRIAMIDHSGCGLGVAAGLVQLGHRLRYTGPEPWPGEAPTEVERQRLELVSHCFGGSVAPTVDAELVVVFGAFADELAALHERRYLDHRFAPEAPLRPTWNPLMYPARLSLWLELAKAATRLAVVDCSDCQGPRECAFEQLPGATLLAREVAPGPASPWRPFPFLYNPVLLWLELLRPESEWLLPTSARRAHWDWAFCGTVQHDRYGDRRRQLLMEVQQRWPHLRGAVTHTEAFVDVLKVLQSVRCGLDLPGAGELCFRLHEYLALGVPVLRPWPFGIDTAPGIERAMVADPMQLRGLDADAVRDVYRQCYAPSVAASALLAAVSAPAVVGAAAGSAFAAANARA